MLDKTDVTGPVGKNDGVVNTICQRFGNIGSKYGIEDALCLFFSKLNLKASCKIDGNILGLTVLIKPLLFEMFVKSEKPIDAVASHDYKTGTIYQTQITSSQAQP